MPDPLDELRAERDTALARAATAMRSCEHAAATMAAWNDERNAILDSLGRYVSRDLPLVQRAEAVVARAEKAEADNSDAAKIMAVLCKALKVPPADCTAFSVTHGAIKALSGMEAEVSRLTSLIDEAREALQDATANLAGAASAYRKYACRSRTVGRGVADPFFTTRASDFDAAVERARALLPRLKEPSRAE